MAEWAAKRFWSEVSLREAGEGWEVLLDGRVLKTPSKQSLVIPSRAVAERVAAEWEAQEEEIAPLTMPFTRAANSAIEKVTPQKEAVIDMLASYGDTDLLLYRASDPAPLVARQAEAWDPVLEWVEERFGAKMQRAEGIMPVSQSAEALSKLRAPLQSADVFTLTGLHDLVVLSGSLSLALAVLEQKMDAESAWLASRVDEIWQEEQWGKDEEATEMAATKRQDFLNASDFVDTSWRSVKP